MNAIAARGRFQCFLSKRIEHPLEPGFDAVIHYPARTMVQGRVTIPDYVPKWNWTKYAIKGVESQVGEPYYKLILIIQTSVD